MMGFQHLFHRLSTGKSKEKEVVTETFKTLIDARFDRLESNFQLLRNEWADSHEKLMLLYDRTRKRIKAAKDAGEQEEPVREGVPLQTRDDVLHEWKSRNGMTNG